MDMPTSLRTMMRISSNESQYIGWLIERLNIDFALSTKPEFWQAMAEAIQHTNWTHPYRKSLAMLFGLPNSVIQAGMRTHEHSALTKLPETVTIYRGTPMLSIKNKKPLKHDQAISWTLSKAVALRFAKSNAIHGRNENPRLITAKVSKADIKLLLLGRGEREIITFKPKVQNIEAVGPGYPGWEVAGTKVNGQLW
ncbi:MAG: hypothetical protein ABI671_14145 [Burkholderiales bacterium]